jgi:uncharacterized protein (TIGR04255 family)
MTVGRDDEIYPNSPLVDVACEIRFAGELAIETQRHLFWERIRDQYPEIRVPYLQPGQAPALQHYRFCNSDGGVVAVALNSLAFSESKYSGHAKFIGEFERLARIFSECYPAIDKLNRVGWRYMNVIPFQREGESIPVNRMLKKGINLPFNVLQHARNFDARFESKHGDGFVIIRLASVANTQAPGVDGVLLDIDFALENSDLRIRNLVNDVKVARSHARAIFEDLIADDYRTYLRGEGQ